MLRFCMRNGFVVSANSASIGRTGIASCTSQHFKMLIMRRIFCNQTSRHPTGETKNVSGRLRMYKKHLKELGSGSNNRLAILIGNATVAGGSIVGLSALCYYGLGLTNKVSMIDKAGLWPEYVTKRLTSTFLYLGGSVAVTAITAFIFCKSNILMKVVMNPWVFLGSFVAHIGSMFVLHSMQYTEEFGKKHLGWVAATSLIGTIIASVCHFGGSLVIKAAFQTAGIVLALSTVAVCAPSDQFLSMAGPLAIGIGVVFTSSIGTWFIPRSSIAGAGIYSVAVYGGLIVYSCRVLYETQRVVKFAQECPLNHEEPYDPINESLGIYIATLNIFIRVVELLQSAEKKLKTRRIRGRR
ncbi:hypothetical protein CHUAL_008689 [Chamberlinius hualienensis]